jgi:hypothetical protein
MNQREGLLILFEATAELPENPSLRRARRWAERRLEVLRIRYALRTSRRELTKFQTHLETCAICHGTPLMCVVGQPLHDRGLNAANEVLKARKLDGVAKG